MELEEVKNPLNVKKKSDYMVSKELTETLNSFWEDSIDWSNGKKYPNRFAYNLIENEDREIVLNHIENFSKTEQLAVSLIDAANLEDKSKIWIILWKFSWLSKKLALSLISSKYQCEEEVILYRSNFKWLDYEVAKRLAMKGILHEYFVSYDGGEHYLSKDNFIWIDENQWQDLIKLSKSRSDSNRIFKETIEEERRAEKNNSIRDNRE